MLRRLPLAAALLGALLLQGCIAYEFEEEFWLRVDGSGTVNVTGTPALWRAFKGLSAGGALEPQARALFEASGLKVRRVTLTRRRGQDYLFISADFADVNALAGTRAFPDLQISMLPRGGRLELEGRWHASGPEDPEGGKSAPGLMAVRFHLPSKVYAHRNAPAGVERGNIVGWRQEVRAALRGESLEFGATLDDRSILWSTVSLFATAILVAFLILGGTVFLVARRGRSRAAASRAREPASGAPPPPAA
jgi:hypothetical protein